MKIYLVNFVEWDTDDFTKERYETERKTMAAFEDREKAQKWVESRARKECQKYKTEDTYKWDRRGAKYNRTYKVLGYTFGDFYEIKVVYLH